MWQGLNGIRAAWALFAGIVNDSLPQRWWAMQAVIDSLRS